MLTVKHLIILSLLYYHCDAWRKLSVQMLNVSYNYSKDLVDMNATLSEDGALFLFIRPYVDLNRLFVTVVVKFRTDSSDDFNISFINKTIDFCKLLSGARYEPLIKLGYKIFSSKAHLPQRCPIKKNDLIYASNYTFATDQLPPVFPETKISFYLGFLVLKNENLHKVLDLKIIADIQHCN